MSTLTGENKSADIGVSNSAENCEKMNCKNANCKECSCQRDSVIASRMTSSPLFDIVGDTPLIRIHDRLYAKVEAYNPTGSVKDRMIRGILRAAVANGELNEDSIIVEATSGNTGIAISAAGAALGLPVEVFMPENMSESRKQMMRAFGATLHLTGHNDFMGAIAGRDEKLNDKRYWSPMQFSNDNNRQAHIETTCLEIHKVFNTELADRQWGAIILGSGTGGTISAFCEYRNLHDLNYDVVMTEPAETPQTHGIQGIYDGADFLMNREAVDHTIKVPTQASINRAATFAREHGILVGISSGANLLVAEEYLKKNTNSNAIAVTLLCDRGERYLEQLNDATVSHPLAKGFESHSTEASTPSSIGADTH